ncbi:hypothetical protein BU17DRAFT_62451 [Hysterangium stoloniferum]|nr:hypothetical protein BU17DRAFT_62451 [Hysterangium stoloniferum]
MSSCNRFADDGYASQLERDYIKCSNFVCCGFTLADMHELVRHFEEHHVTIDAIPSSLDTMPDLISPETASSSTLETHRSTYTATPPPDLFPTLTAPFTPRESAFSPVHVSSSSHSDSNIQSGAYMPSSYAAYANKDGFGARLYSEGCDPAPRSIMGKSSPRVQICLPPSHLIADTPPAAAYETQPYPDPPANIIPHAYPPTIAPIPIYARHPNLSIITDLPIELGKGAKGRKVNTNTSWTVESEGNDTQPAPQRRKKNAHSDCIKSYMNLNGLKYHLSKGACQYSAS